MTATLVILLAACAPQPASIQFADVGPSTVHETTPVKLPTAQVLDAKGQAIEPAPVVTWTASPEGVATLDATAGTLTPVADGSVEIVAQVGEVKGTWSLQVSLPDEVRVAGAPEGGAMPMGAPVTLTAAVYDGEQALSDMAVTWTSSDENIATVADGVVTPVAEGDVVIAAAGGGHSADVALKVTAGEAVATAE